MTDEEKPLLNRKEEMGRMYPLWIERLLMVGFIVSLGFVPSIAMEWNDEILGILLGWCLYPIVAIVCMELFGRLLQSN